MPTVRGGLKGGLVLALALHLHFHHHFHGPPVDYAGVALAGAASWAGVPGPGEPVLIAAGVLAARHQLDLASVLGSAWIGATLGGILGWLVGLRFGRRLMTTRGPFHRLRVNALERGERFFERYAVLAIVLTPSWIAGIHRVRSAVYMPVNAMAAAVWAVGIGLGAYFAGPPVVDVVNDLGWVIVSLVVVLAAGAAGGELLRRRRRRRLAS